MILIICCICFFILIGSVGYRTYTVSNNLHVLPKGSIGKSGYTVASNVIDPPFIANLWDNGEFKAIFDLIKQNGRLAYFIKRKLGSEFVLQDYIMFLENGVLHTCHRDSNAKMLRNSEYESYTVIVYVGDMKECLDLIPGSHTGNNGVSITDYTQTFMCKPGDAILFNAGVVHAGSINGTADNRRIQLKVAHKKDSFPEYDKYYKRIDKANSNEAWTKQVQKHVTCNYPALADMTQGKDTSYIGGKISNIGKVFSKVFYGDEDYYVLKDAFT